MRCNQKEERYINGEGEREREGGEGRGERGRAGERERGKNVEGESHIETKICGLEHEWGW